MDEDDGWITRREFFEGVRGRGGNQPFAESTDAIDRLQVSIISILSIVTHDRLFQSRSDMIQKLLGMPEFVDIMRRLRSFFSLYNEKVSDLFGRFLVELALICLLRRKYNVTDDERLV